MQLDKTIESSQERTAYVKSLLSQPENQNLSNHMLEVLADYIIFATDKEAKQMTKFDKQITSANRHITRNKRETSFQGLAMRLENGEDGIYNMIANDKNIIFTPNISITPKDIAEVPGLKRLVDSIAKVEAEYKAATGKRKYQLGIQLKEMRQDQYVLKNAYRQPMRFTNAIKSFAAADFSETITINAETGEVSSNGIISFFNPDHISALLRNYSNLKEESWGNFSSDAYYLLEDLDHLIDGALEQAFPLYYDLLIYKIDGKSNAEIQILLENKYHIRHSFEYISSLWRNKIPKIIAETAKKDYLTWYYTEKEPGYWKKCNKCGQIKLGHPLFFSSNTSSKDRFYSVCRECRKSKGGEQ